MEAISQSNCKVFEIQPPSNFPIEIEKVSCTKIEDLPYYFIKKETVPQVRTLRLPVCYIETIQQTEWVEGFPIHYRKPRVIFSDSIDKNARIHFRKWSEIEDLIKKFPELADGIKQAKEIANYEPFTHLTFKNKLFDFLPRN